MQIETVRVTNLFEKHYRKLPKRVKQEAQKKEGLFRNYPFDPVLKTHKLHGAKSEAYAFWINYSYRIKFIFLDPATVLYLDVGKHDIYP